jgi:hypothetical protein
MLVGISEVNDFKWKIFFVKYKQTLMYVIRKAVSAVGGRSNFWWGWGVVLKLPTKLPGMAQPITLKPLRTPFTSE